MSTDAAIDKTGIAEVAKMKQQLGQPLTAEEAESIGVKQTKPASLKEEIAEQVAEGAKQEKEPKEKKPKAPRYLSEEKLIAKYPHVIPGTLRKDGNKNTVDIKCVKCGAKRAVHTSDLFQVNTCVACKAQDRKARKPKKTATEQKASIDKLAGDILGEEGKNAEASA